MNSSGSHGTLHDTPHGTPHDTDHEVVSRHVTSEGVLVYLRTPTGGLHAKLLRWSGGSDVLVDSRQDRPSGPPVRSHLRAC